MLTCISTAKNNPVLVWRLPNICGRGRSGDLSGVCWRSTTGDFLDSSIAKEQGLVRHFCDKGGRQGQYFADRLRDTHTPWRLHMHS